MWAIHAWYVKQEKRVFTKTLGIRVEVGESQETSETTMEGPLDCKILLKVPKNLTLKSNTPSILGY